MSLRERWNTMIERESQEYAEHCDNESGGFLSHQLEAIRAKAYKACGQDLLPLVERLASALERYTNQDAWHSNRILLGNGTYTSAPGLGMGPFIAREALTELEAFLRDGGKE